MASRPLSMLTHNEGRGLSASLDRLDWSQSRQVRCAFLLDGFERSSSVGETVGDCYLCTHFYTAASEELPSGVWNITDGEWGLNMAMY